MIDSFDPVLPLRPDGSRVPLFCAPPISGSPYGYRALVPLLDPEQPVYALEAPGFHNDEEPLDSVPAHSARYLAALHHHRAGRPVALLGWSMGAVVAYDLARRLADAGVPVGGLILVDPPAPGPLAVPPPGTAARLLVRDLAELGGLPRGPIRAALARAPEDAGPDDVFAAVVRAGVLPAECDAEFLHDRYRPFAAHLRLLGSWRPVGGYPGPVTLIRATESSTDVGRWRELAAGLHDYAITGDHYTIWRGDALTAMGALVRRVLDGGRQVTSA
ncbi:alpha/beta fold hydrolase [Micromonospora sp. R77]|uniref:thioesterase domain-containing protein n=1 Tax=Micromonospora sp. R77 TaxID=2925836 RepID=UPI001F622078|nr:alpha/beta fold hydrolase [Micromonospora sp. R77]MCI4066843.1 alpha/beta fold hydrolase [Micromonospora sp. R77]